MAKKVDNDIIDYNALCNELKRTRLPILTLDKKWLDLFEEGKTKEIMRLEKELNNVVKVQGRINSEREDLKNLKRNLMSEIVVNMDAVGNSRIAKKMEKSKQLIEEINDKLILIEDNELSLPTQVRDANVNLAAEGVKEICKKSIKNDEDISYLEEWIEETRIELKKKILLRQKKLEENERINNYLDGTIGRDLINKYKNHLKSQD